MKFNNKNIVYIIFSFVLGFAQVNCKDKEFITSFIKSYDISPQGRYSRGYPDYLAKLSEQSLVELENAIRNKGFNIHGRFILSGYEQNAVPSYKFNVEDNNINDEPVVKDTSGWSMQVGNMFGFTTGFLLKDCNRFNKGVNSIFKHIGVERVEIFDDSAQILQKHAFSESYPIIIDFKKHIEKAIAENNIKLALKLILEYWKSIYEDEKKHRDSSVVATQDILFSIMYGKYLWNSSVDIKKFFTGPDITYPIRVLQSQPLEATVNSQDFLKNFVKDINPLNDESTAYIFCSFVDGVGKSTLLGNIINWMKFENDFVKYEAVNNSSSQLATVYEFSPKTFIVDLPAQISHYCAKPDGYVFVNIDSCQLNEEIINKLIGYFNSNQIMVAIGKKFLNDISLIKSGRSVSANNKFYIKYLENLNNLGLDTPWIPFELDEHLFVVNAFTNQIRVLVSLDQAHSSGLKVREPELMIFDGAIMPMNYNSFLDDLIAQLEKRNVKNVVFVDFISMYPRSSRENVRINFMLQQLKILFNDKFDIEKSFYRNFASTYEIFPLFDKNKNELLEGLVLESLSRDCLNDYILQSTSNNIEKLSFEDLAAQVKSKIDAMEKSDIDYVYSLVSAKLDAENDGIKHYKFSKNVESCWHVPLEKVAQLSEAMKEVFSSKINDPVLNNNWNSLDRITKVDINNSLVTFASGAKADILLRINENSKSVEERESLAAVLRTVYYKTILGLLTSDMQEETLYPPVLFIKYGNEYLLIEKIMADDKNIPLAAFLNIKTYQKLFAFSADEEDPNNQLYYYVWYYKCHMGQENLCGQDFFVRTSDLNEMIDHYNLWSAFSTTSQEHTYFADDPDSLCVLVEALATIEMVIKHPKAEIMPIYESKKDFNATIKFIENIWLPIYVGLELEDSLFGSCDQAKPIIELDLKDTEG